MFRPSHQDERLFKDSFKIENPGIGSTGSIEELFIFWVRMASYHHECELKLKLRQTCGLIQNQKDVAMYWISVRVSPVFNLSLVDLIDPKRSLPLYRKDTKQQPEPEPEFEKNVQTLTGGMFLDIFEAHQWQMIKRKSLSEREIKEEMALIEKEKKTNTEVFDETSNHKHKLDSFQSFSPIDPLHFIPPPNTKQPKPLPPLKK